MKYFLTGLFIADLTFLFTYHNFLSIIFLILIAVRVCILGEYKLMLVVSILFLFLMIFNKSIFDSQIESTRTNKEKTFLIAKSQITIDGDSFKTTGINDQTRAKNVIYYQIQNEDELNRLKKLPNYFKFTVIGDVKKPTKATNFFQFDVSNYYSNTNISNIYIVKRIEEIKPVNNLLENFKQSLIDFFNRFPKSLKNYASALFIGNLDDDFYRDNPGITQLSLIHLFSISGFQVVILIKAINFISLRIKLSKRLNDLISVFVLPVFFAVADFQNSLLRPIISGEIKLFFNKFSKIEILSISLIVALFVDQKILFTLGGQLSFLLSFGLIISNKLGYFKQTIFLTFLSIPIILNSKFEIHILSLFTNLIAIPLFGFVIIPLIVFAVVCVEFKPVVNLIEDILNCLNRTIDWISKLPGKIIFGYISPSVSVLLIFLVIFCVLHRNKRITYLILGSAMSFIFLIIHFPINGEFSAFDIGQGDSLLYRTYFNSQVNLIDTGGKVAFNNENWQKKKNENNQASSIILNYLKARGISHIDNLILTHKDNDHIGNAKFVLRDFKVINLLVPSGMEETDEFKKNIKPFIKKTNLITVTDKTKIKNFKAMNPKDKGKAENDDSIALFFNADGLKIFSAGDLGKKGELEILKTHPNLKIDLLKIGHHGSKTSSDGSFIKRTKVKFAFISVGKHNSYGHPNAQTIQTLNNNNVEIFSTAKSGMISYRYNLIQRELITYRDENK